jgi:hypothetical protein
VGPPIEPDALLGHYADLIRQSWRAAEVRRQAGRDPEDPAELAASLMLNGHAVPRQVRAGIEADTRRRERNRWARVCDRLNADVDEGLPLLMELRRRLLDDDSQVTDG